MNLDFVDGPGFKQRGRSVPGLADAVRKALQELPPSQGLQSHEIRHRGCLYGLISSRRGQRVSLMYIFRLPDEEANLNKVVRDVARWRKAKEAL